MTDVSRRRPFDDELKRRLMAGVRWLTTYVC